MPETLLITSKSNARVKALRASFSGEAARAGERLGVEGEHLIAEAIRSGLEIEGLFVREGSQSLLDRPALAAVAACGCFTLSREVFAGAVETASPQGIAAVVRIPLLTLTRLAPEAVVLVVEALQDPGNLGTLLRSAEAFGVQQMYVTPETVNPWNPKVVRASAGSVFRVPLARAPLEEIGDQLQAQGARLYAAVAQPLGAASLLETVFAPRTALLIGNEGAGLSAQALRLAHHRVCIPVAVESLNAAVAGSTLLYEAMRQRACASCPPHRTP